MLCENTTPKKTAYNAYRNENRRVRRAEGTKMYAVGDAYKVHTECIQAYKRVREEFFFYFFLYCLFFYLLLLASSGIPRRTMNDFLLPVVADSRFFGLSSPVRRAVRHHPNLFLAPRSSCAPAGVYAIRPSRRLRCLDGRSKKNLYALYASKNRLCTLCEDTTPKKTAYNAYKNENRRVRRAERLKMYAVRDAYRLHTKCIQVSTST